MHVEATAPGVSASRPGSVWQQVVDLLAGADERGPGLPRRPGRRRARARCWRSGWRCGPRHRRGRLLGRRAVRGAGGLRLPAGAGPARPRRRSSPPRPTVLVTLDTGSPDRLGTLADRLGQRRVLVVLDHHASGTPYGDLHLVDDRPPRPWCWWPSCSTGSGSTLTREIADPLYTGLVTDTGSFKYAATTPAVHALAGRLLATGIRHDLISRGDLRHRAVRLRPAARPGLLRARLEPDAVGGLGLVWTDVAGGPRAARGWAWPTSRASSTCCGRPGGRGRRRAQGRPARGRLEGVHALQGVGRRRRGVRSARRRRAPLRRRLQLARRASSTTSARLRAALATAPQRRDGPMTAPDGLLVVDKPAGWTSPRRRRPGPAAGRHPQGRPRRHARPDGDRRARARRRPGHPAARPPRR